MIVGLTGGIGSGKSTVAEIFRHLGVPVFVADEESKKLLDTDLNLQQDLIKLLGEELVKEGRVDRKYMASRIFSNKDLLEKANALIHPAVGRAFYLWYKNQSFPYVIREAAILFESGSYKDCHKIIAVTAPEEMRLKRVMQRSGESEQQVRDRMSKQWPQKQKVALSHYKITNDLSKPVIPQVLKIHEDIIRQANSQS